MYRLRIMEAAPEESPPVPGSPSPAAPSTVPSYQVTIPFSAVFHSHGPLTPSPVPPGSGIVPPCPSSVTSSPFPSGPDTPTKPSHSCPSPFQPSTPWHRSNFPPAGTVPSSPVPPSIVTPGPMTRATVPPDPVPHSPVPTKRRYCARYVRNGSKR